MKIKITLTATREYDVSALYDDGDFNEYFNDEGEIIDEDALKQALVDSIEDIQGEFVDDCYPENIEVKGEILR